MALFNLETIKTSYFGESIFEQGEFIYQTSNIDIIETIQNKITDEVRINAKMVVKDDEFEVSITYVEKSGHNILVGERSCSCKNHNTNKENCAHMAALIVNVNNYSEEEITQIDSNTKKTSSSAIMIQDSFLENDLLVLHSRINLVPYIEFFSNNVRVYFKLKNFERKEYSLNSLEYFVDLFKNEKVHEYSKNFTIKHDKAFFDEHSIKLINFIATNLNNEINQKYINITEFNIESFISLLNGKQINTKMFESNIENLQYKQLESKPLLKISECDELYKLWIEYPFSISFFYKNHLISKDNSTIYTWKFQNPLMEKLLNSIGQKKINISKEDFYAFYENVVVIVEDELVIDTNFNPEIAFFDTPKICAIVDYERKKLKISIAMLHNDEYVSLESAADKIPMVKQKKLSSFLNSYASLVGDQYFISNNDIIYEFCDIGLHNLKKYVDIIKTTTNFDKLHVHNSLSFVVNAKISNNLLEVDLNVMGINSSEFVQIFNAYKQNKKYYQLNDNSFVSLNDPKFKQLADFISRSNINEKELLEGSVLIDKANSFFINEAANLYQEIDINVDESTKKFIENLSYLNIKEFAVPAQLNAELREYQTFGYRYLKTMYENNFGCIIADDMGLGKTIQILTFILSNPGKKTLICVPSSLVLNWEQEIKKHAPSLRPLLIYGSQEIRKELISSIGDFDITITSYDLLKRDIHLYETLSFDHFIIDEAQYIKNNATQNFKSVKKINADFKVALSGTPIENNLSELWAISNFVNPGYLFNASKFATLFEIPITKYGDDDALRLLKSLCSPFILRRMKTEVLKDLPEKTEIFTYSQMSDVQRELYVGNIKEAQSFINGFNDTEIGTSKLQILKMLTRLRQISCEPRVLYNHIEAVSPKIQQAMEIITNSIASGHKVLLFSQFTSMFPFIEEKLAEQNISYYKLTGATKKEERFKMADKFNTDDTNVFLISLKAGGTGLNLVGADIVIHFDPWWNMSAQNQATDRVYRIGQKNNVTVYKLIAHGTIEQKIVEMQERKGDLAQSILENNDVSISSMTKDDILRLFE